MVLAMVVLPVLRSVWFRRLSFVHLWFWSSRNGMRQEKFKFMCLQVRFWKQIWIYFDCTFYETFSWWVHHFFYLFSFNTVWHIKRLNFSFQRSSIVPWSDGRRSRNFMGRFVDIVWFFHIFSRRLLLRVTFESLESTINYYILTLHKCT